MFGFPNESTIMRLRVNGSDLDPLALRGRVTSILNEVSFEPRLPRSATLFIRKLSDPLPGSLQLDTTFPHAPQAWRHAFNVKFDQLVSSAARPAFGPVADSVESVVFYDYAELLACLSADWCSGSVMTRWWWQSLLKRGDVGRLIKQLWRDRIEYAPAAMQHLVKRDAVVEFVKQLSEVEAEELVQRVVRMFGLPQIKLIKATDRVVEGEAVERDLAVWSSAAPPPWVSVVPESKAPELRAAQQLFVGIVLMIHRAPTRVRSLSFAREVERWIERANLVEPPFVHEQSIDVIDVVETVEMVEKEFSDEFLIAPSTHAPIRANQHHAPVVPLTTPPPTPPRSALSVAPEVCSQPEPTIVTNPTVIVPEEHTTEVVTPDPIFSTLDAITIETELAGLFYLINLAIFMEIYSDFTSPVEQFHDDLSIWHFVSIVGREFTDQDDPVWRLLDNLAEDRDQQEPPVWLINMLPDIKKRLRLALGIDDEADLAELLLHHHARVTITPTHIDIFFSLATHPIEIRVSGLDRDPGWVPAAGRFIAFHYD